MTKHDELTQKLGAALLLATALEMQLADVVPHLRKNTDFANRLQGLSNSCSVVCKNRQLKGLLNFDTDNLYDTAVKLQEMAANETEVNS